MSISENERYWQHRAQRAEAECERLRDMLNRIASGPRRDSVTQCQMAAEALATPPPEGEPEVATTFIGTLLVGDPLDEGDGPWMDRKAWKRMNDLPPGTHIYASSEPMDAPPTPEQTRGPLTWSDESIVDQFLNRDFEVISYPDGDTVPDGWPEEWDEKPFARIRWAEDSGDPEAGMPGWSGFCLTADQSGTVLGDLISGNEQAHGDALPEDCKKALVSQHEQTLRRHLTASGVPEDNND